MKRSGIFTFLKLMFLLKLILIPIFRLFSWFFKNTKLGKSLVNYFDILLSTFNKFGDFSQKFIISVAVGFFSYLLFAIASHYHIKPIIESKNYVFDSTLTIFTEYGSKENIELKPVFIAFDEESYQDTSWSTATDDSISFNHNILQLVDEAYRRGSRHVFIDFVLNSDEKKQEQQLVQVNILRDKYKDSKEPLHLYAVIATKPDPCLPSTAYYNQIESSIWQSVPLQTNNFFIHPVSPTIYESEDKVIRHWNLFTVNQQLVTNTASQQETTQWVFLPSPQLAYHVVSSIEENSNDNGLQKLSSLPWLNSFDSDKKKFLDNISRSSYTENIYQQLLNLTDSTQLRSYCSKSSDNCIAPDYVKRDSDLNKKETKNDELIAELAYKNSEVCKNKINHFVTNLQENTTNQDTMENRIIYSMKAWNESERPEKEANYTLYTPIELFNQNAKSRTDTWQDQFVAIGATYKDSRDINYLTPVGPMPGVLINLNAVASFDSFGAIGLLAPIHKFLLNLTVILVAALLFARLTVGDATIIILSIVIALVIFFHHWMFNHGIWIEFGLPLFVMNFVSFILEKREQFLDEKNKEKENNEKIHISDQLKIANLKLRILESKVKNTPWKQVNHDLDSIDDN